MIIFTKIEKNVGGETLFSIITSYIVFKRNRKIYSYATERREPDYLSTTNESEKIFDLIAGKVGNVGKSKQTKEEK